MRWVDYQARWLVDHDKIFILKHNVQVHGLRLESLTLRCWSQLDNQRIASFNPGLGLFGHLGLPSNLAGRYQLLQIASGKLGQYIRQSLIQPLAMLRC